MARIFLEFPFPTSGSALSLAHQLECAHKTVDWRGQRPRFRLVGESVSADWTLLGEAISRARVPPSDIVMAARVADLARTDDRMEQSLRSLGAGGHRLQLDHLDIGNFSHAELERFNQGAGPGDVLAAMTTLLKLERAFPASFDFRECAGLSIVLFTPWTTIQDLEINLRVIQRLDLAPAFSGLMQSRLRLYPDQAIHRLARADGLLADVETHDAARWNYSSTEVAWRFKDPAVPLLSAVFDRLLPLAEGPQDQLARQVRARYEQLDISDKSEVKAALLILELVKCAGTPDSAEELLTRLGTADQLLNYAEPVERYVDATYGEWLVRAKSVLSRGGFKPVHKHEHVPQRKVADLRDAIRVGFGPDVTTATSRHYPDDSSIVDLFYGYEREAVSEAARLSTALLAEPLVIDDRMAIGRLGALLGYPTCCVEAHCSAGFEADDSEWALVARRSATDELIPSQMVMMLLLYDLYLTCGLSCQRSLDQAREIELALQKAGLEPPGSSTLDWSDFVILLHLDARANFAFLQRLGTDSGGITYRPLHLVYEARAMDAVAQGNRLSVEPQSLSVYRDDEHLHTFAGNAFLFDAQRRWGDPQFWTALFESLKTTSEGLYDQQSETKEANSDSGSAEEQTPVAGESPDSNRVPASDRPFTESEMLSIAQSTLPKSGELRVRRLEPVDTVGPELSGTSPWIELLVEGAGAQSALTVVSRAVQGEDQQLYVAAAAVRFEPSGGTSDHRSFVRSFATALDHRLVQEDTEAQQTRPTEDHWLVELVEQAAYPNGLPAQTFAGYAACWPVRAQNDRVTITLVQQNSLLELVIEDKETDCMRFAETGRCAVSYLNDTPLDEPSKKAAFSHFLQRLSEVEDESSAIPVV